MRDRSITIRNAKLFSAWTNNPHTMMVWVRIQHCAKKKKLNTELMKMRTLSGHTGSIKQYM